MTLDGDFINISSQITHKQDYASSRILYSSCEITPNSIEYEINYTKLGDLDRFRTTLFRP